jgi:hypothetical protein
MERRFRPVPSHSRDNLRCYVKGYQSNAHGLKLLHTPVHISQLA